VTEDEWQEDWFKNSMERQALLGTGGLANGARTDTHLSETMRWLARTAAGQSSVLHRTLVLTISLNSVE
tara:strand:- start:1284 stop:1490 length:207 start_codon:yes stop_codon:yes gene_type:complete